MLYITIIIIAIIIAVSVLIYKYISVTYNPNLYESRNITFIKNCINDLLDKYDKYDKADSKESYKYHVSDTEIKQTLTNIKLMLDDDNN